MSDTPRTCAAEIEHGNNPRGPVVYADFARQLERELAAFKEALGRTTSLSTTLGNELADAKAEIERLTAELTQYHDLTRELAEFQRTEPLKRRDYAQMGELVDRLTECVRAADELRNYMGDGYALVAKYDEARKDVTI